MKHQSKHSQRNTTRNQNTGMWYEIQKTEKEKAIKVAENTPDEIKNKKIKYLLK